MDFKQIVKEVLLTEANEIEKAAKIDFDIDKAVELIVNSKGKLIVTGVWKSGLVGDKNYSNTCKIQELVHFSYIQQKQCMVI